MFIASNLVVVSLVLWAVTFIGFKTNNIVPEKDTSTTYECGFKNVSTTKVQSSMNSILSLIFVVLYEIEFSIVVPIFFNKTIFAIEPSIILTVITVFFLTFILDVSIDGIN